MTQVTDKNEVQAQGNGDATLLSETHGSVALRTVQVYLTNGSRKLKVNALLDDASTKTYINADVAAELGLQRQSQRVMVSVLNGQVETFETSLIECAIQSLDSKSSYHITTLVLKYGHIYRVYIFLRWGLRLLLISRVNNRTSIRKNS